MGRARNTRRTGGTAGRPRNRSRGGQGPKADRQAVRRAGGGEGARAARSALRRFLAFSVDGLVLYVPAGVVGAVILAAGFMAVDSIGVVAPTGSLAQVTPWAVGSWATSNIVAEALVVYRWGATPGKRLFGVRVLSKDGSKLTFMSSLMRASTKLAPFWFAAVLWWPAIVAVAGAASLLFWRRGPLPHDLLADTEIRADTAN